MKTTYTDFWNCFLVMQPDLLVACENIDLEMLQDFLQQLNDHPILRELKLEVCINYPAQEHPKVKLQFLTQGVKKRKKAALQLIEEAPLLDTWEYYAGIPPYSNPKEPKSLYFLTIGENVHTDQVYVCIDKTYKTTNKMHLQVFLKLNRTGVPKNEIKPFARSLMIHYFGEELYYKNISRIKIVRRKPKTLNFFPLRDLKTLLTLALSN